MTEKKKKRSRKFEPVVTKVQRENIIYPILAGEIRCKEQSEKYKLNYATVNTWVNRERRALEKMEATKKELRIERILLRSKERERIDFSRPQALPEVVKVAERVETPIPIKDYTPKVEEAQVSNYKHKIDSNTQSVNDIVSSGLKAFKDALISIHDREKDNLSTTYENLQLINQRIQEVIPMCIKPSDLLSLAKAMQIITQQTRDSLLLPYGSVDPNKILKTDSTSPTQHLHLHNHGMNNFKPK